MRPAAPEQQRGPDRLAAAEASSTAALAVSSSGPWSASASSAISRLTVNPTPPSIDTAARSRQPRPAGRPAGVSRMVSQEKPKMPTTLPTSRPTTTPSATGSVNTARSASPPIGTPAANSANTGTHSPADQGCSRCSRRSAGASCSSGSGRTRVSSPSTTPAIVACTPASCTSAQTSRPSGT